jgi:prepilin-type N-terminal cleavage/methylation domain-containing protein
MKNRTQAFTLIELLTVIAIIGILAAIIIPTVGKVRDQAKRAQCLSNVRQITVALVSYANQDKRQRFPDTTPNDPPSGTGSTQRGGWAWDVTHAAVNELVNRAGRNVMYCPSSFMMTNYNIDQLYLYQPTFAVTSYVLLIPGTPQIGTQFLSERVSDSYPVTLPIARTLGASQRPLVVDAIIGSGSNYLNVTGGLPNNVSNHMNGNRPAGGHTGYVDGHVKWRPFKEANGNTINDINVYSKKGAGQPEFWF